MTAEVVLHSVALTIEPLAVGLLGESVVFAEEAALAPAVFEFLVQLVAVKPLAIKSSQNGKVGIHVRIRRGTAAEEAQRL